MYLQKGPNTVLQTFNSAYTSWKGSMASHSHVLLKIMAPYPNRPPVGSCAIYFHCISITKIWETPSLRNYLRFLRIRRGLTTRRHAPPPPLFAPTRLTRCISTKQKSPHNFPYNWSSISWNIWSLGRIFLFSFSTLFQDVRHVCPSQASGLYKELAAKLCTCGPGV